MIVEYNAKEKSIRITPTDVDEAMQIGFIAGQIEADGGELAICFGGRNSYMDATVARRTPPNECRERPPIAPEPMKIPRII